MHVSCNINLSSSSSSINSVEAHFVFYIHFYLPYVAYCKCEIDYNTSGSGLLLAWSS